jgi:hypothetical protein
VQTPSLSACQSTRLCRICDQPIAGKNSHAIYCGKKCADRSRAYKRSGVCKTCGKHSPKLGPKGYCSRQCAFTRPRAQDPRIEQLIKHAEQGLNCKRSARLLGTSGSFVYKNRRKLGLSVPSRKEWQRAYAVERGAAVPERWGKRDPSTLEEWQAWALDSEQRKLLRHERKVSWSKAVSFYWQNRAKVLSHMAKYARKKYNTDPQYRFKCLMRNHVKRIFRKAKTKKEGRTIEYLGCSMLHARKHIEKQFREGMHWNNHGSVWHIDHIIPLAKFDLTDPAQRKRANHFTNLQPLTVAENMKKRDKIIQKHQLALL